MLNAEKYPNKSPLIPFLIRNAALGFVGAIVFVGVLLFLNIGNLQTVVFQSDVGMFAMVLMTFMIGLTFASLQMGYAVMFNSDKIGQKRQR